MIKNWRSIETWRWKLVIDGNLEMKNWMMMKWCWLPIVEESRVRSWTWSWDRGSRQEVGSWPWLTRSQERLHFFLLWDRLRFETRWEEEVFFVCIASRRCRGGIDREHHYRITWHGFLAGPVPGFGPVPIAGSFRVPVPKNHKFVV